MAVIRIFTEPSVGAGPALINLALNEHRGGEWSKWWFIRVAMIPLPAGRPRFMWDGKEVPGFRGAEWH